MLVSHLIAIAARAHELLFGDDFVLSEALSEDHLLQALTLIEQENVPLFLSRDGPTMRGDNIEAVEQCNDKARLHFCLFHRKGNNEGVKFIVDILNQKAHAHRQAGGNTSLARHT